MNKNVYKVGTDEWMKKVSRGFFAVFMVGLVLLGVFRLFSISIIKGSMYRSIAETDAYTENKLTARRGTIFDSDMNVLSTSYGVYNIVADPVALDEKLDADIRTTLFNRAKAGNPRASLAKDDPYREQLRAEAKENYYNCISDAFADIINEGLDVEDKKYLSKEDIYSALTTLIKKNKKTGEEYDVRYAPVAKGVTVEQKKKIDFLITSYFNYFRNLFYHKVTDGDREWYEYYDYKTGESFLATEYESKQPGAGKKLTESILGCIVGEASAFIIEEDSCRSYPDDGYCSSFLGITNGNKGVYGLEAYYDSVLSGKDGQVSGLAVNYSGQMKDKSNAVENDVLQGGNLVLTIRSQIQKILEDNLKNVYYRYSADETYGIVMNCKTGAVYAMGNYPNYDLNNPQQITDEKNALEKARLQIVMENTARNIKDKEGNILEPTEKEIKEKARNNQWSCFCVNYPYELGSTFKMFTASAGIEEGVIDPESSVPFFSCGGAYTIIQGEKPIRCSHNKAHGSLDLGNALAKSCNGFFVHLGLTLGADAFIKYFKSFGFNEKTGIDVYGEITGYSVTSSKMNRIQLGSTAYGQTATITPIQLITAASAVANGGKLVTPYMVDKIIDSDGNLISKTETKVKRRVISEETSKIMTEKLKKVIYDDYGTAHKYFTLEGYEAAGKTGSGEIQGMGRSVGENDYKYTASFVGYAPADDPEVIILFGIRNPEGGYLSGGEIAAPPASTVMQCAMAELNIPKSSEKHEGVVPDVEGLPILTAKTFAANDGMTAVQYGEGETVVAQYPPVETPIPDSGLIALFTDEESFEQSVKVPSFSGMTKQEAIAAARKAEINVSCIDWSSDGDTVYSQDFGEDYAVYPGQVVKIYFKSE